MTETASERTARLDPPINADNAREMQARAMQSRRANTERTRQMKKEHAALLRQVEKMEAALADRAAAIVEAKADARAARSELAGMRRRLEAEVAARAEAERRTAPAGTPRHDPGEALDAAATGAVRTLSSVLRSLATAARTGEAWRSGADAAALLDGIVRAAAAVQALQDRAAAGAAGSRRSSSSTLPAIEASASDVGAIVGDLRARLQLGGVGEPVSRKATDHYSESTRVADDAEG